MYVRGTRFSFNGAKAEAKGAEVYNNVAKAMWGGQPGFHSMQRFKIVGGPNDGQQYVVVRFASKHALEAARAAIAQKREAMLKELEAAGCKAEEAMELEEIV